MTSRSDRAPMGCWGRWRCAGHCGNKGRAGKKKALFIGCGGSRGGAERRGRTEGTNAGTESRERKHVTGGGLTGGYGRVGRKWARGAARPGTCGGGRTHRTSKATLKGKRACTTRGCGGTCVQRNAANVSVHVRVRGGDGTGRRGSTPFGPHGEPQPRSGPPSPYVPFRARRRKATE